MYLGIAAKFHFHYEANLSESINYYFPWNHQKIYGFLVISGGIEVY